MNDKNKQKSIKNITEELDPNYDPQSNPEIGTKELLGSCGCCCAILAILTMLLFAMISPYRKIIILVFVIICWAIGIANAFSSSPPINH
ncbi:MAG: hypothetical protein PHR53_09520 [Bacteroidales bacterium]|nr:hypothetical protein [Bacteroidales bacterium]